MGFRKVVLAMSIAGDLIRGHTDAILFAHGSGKEQVDVFFQLFSHKESFPSNR